MPLDSITATDITPELVARAIQEYWPMERELLATIVEMLDVLIRITAKAHGAKRLPESVKIPRPYLKDAAGHSSGRSDEPMGASEFSRVLLGGGGF